VAALTDAEQAAREQAYAWLAKQLGGQSIVAAVTSQPDVVPKWLAAYAASRPRGEVMGPEQAARFEDDLRKLVTIRPTLYRAAKVLTTHKELKLAAKLREIADWCNDVEINLIS